MQQTAVALGDIVVVDGALNGVRGTNKNYQLFGTRDCSIQQIALQHPPVPRMNRHYDDWKLRALRLVHRDAISELQGIRFAETVMDEVQVLRSFKELFQIKID